MSAGGGLGSSERSRLGPEVADSCGRPKKSLSCFSCFAGSAMSGVTTPDVRPTGRREDGASARALYYLLEM